MNESLIAGAIFVAGVIFTAGGIVYSTRKETAQNKVDINRVGAKVRDETKHRYNLGLVLMAMTDSREERFKLATLLKEE